jgi:alanine racemase
MLVAGQLVPTVGSICMDMCMLDISDLPTIKTGDEVIVFGENPTIHQFAKWENTIVYEILTNISKRVKRIYFEE